MKKKLVCMLAVLCMVIAVSGCKSSEASDKLKEGYDAVIAQDFSTALSCFNEAVSDGCDYEDAFRGMGLAYMGCEQYGKAVNSFRSALSYAGMFPGDMEYDINYYMALCYYKLGEYDNAIAVYDGIIGIRPKDVNAYFMRGNMETLVGNLDIAVEDFDKAVKLDKDNYGLYIDVYSILSKNGYEGQGQKYLDVVLAADKSEISDYDKGRLCYYQGEYAQGANYLERAKKNGEGSEEVINLLADCYKQTEQYDLAAMIYDSYLAENANPEMYNQLGLCYVEQGDYASALNAFQVGTQIQENNTCMQTLLLNEIACYEFLLDFDTAKDKMEEYMLIYPYDEQIEKEYAFLTTR